MITLKDIYLENFMTIDSLYLKFDDDVVVSIYGQNGAGKSTLLYAIAFAITGYRYGESYRDYVMTGKDTAKVILNAEFKGKPIKYTIDLKGKNKTGNPIKKLVEYDNKEYINSDYSQFMKEHDLDIIENIMFLFQGNKEIIESKPAERASMLKKLFQFEFDDIVESLKSNQEQAKNSLIETNAILNELKTRIYESTPLQREILPQAIANWELKIKEIDKNLAAIGNVDESSIEKCNNELNDVRREITSINSKIDCNKAQKDIYYNKINKLNSFINENSSEGELNYLITECNRSIENIKHKGELKKEEFNSLSYEVKLKKYELDEITEQIKISETGGICHACGQAIDINHIKKLEEKKSALEKEIGEIQENIKNLEYNPDSIKYALNVWENKKEKYINNLDDIKNSKRDLDTFLEKVKSIEELLTTQNNFLINLDNTLCKLNEEASQLEKIKPLLSQRDSLVNEQNQLIQSVQSAKDIIIANKERRKNNAIIERDKKERDDKVACMNIKSNDLLIDINNKKVCIDIFENLFPNFIILQACKKLEDYINSIVQKLFPYMKVSLKQNRSGVNFYYTVGEEQEELAVCMASGAQKMILSLAYSVALARMYGLNCILIDEADASMTPENAKLVYDFIASLDDFSQIIFISHREESREAMKNSGRDNVIFYEVSNGNYNQVSG